eukprot:GHRR01017723.1.p1 GENE.GHRR01017723.1~~GHRR01017723.1.p1  ORF type:complete len:256 (+),score=95.85 GHRR01017723.1:288-1055(+)
MRNPTRPFAGLEQVDFTGLRMRLVDAESQVIGRLAAYLSVILQGKDKPVFAPNKDHGDICVVTNAEKAVFTGRKWEGKLYRWHTGYPGGLKEITAKELWRRDPTELIRKAVYGMLPKNNLREARMRKLRLFPGPEHPFKGVELIPWQMPPRKLQDKGLGWLLPDGFEPMNPEAYVKRMRGSKVLVQQQPEGLLQPSSSLAAAPPLQDEQATAAAAVNAAGGAAAFVRPPQPAGFEDLLTAEELAFVTSRMQGSIQ